MRADPLQNPDELIRRVYAYVAVRLGDGPDAEDVTSATFERAVRYRDGYRSSKGEPIAWLIGIARRCIVAHLTGQAYELELDETRDDPAPQDLEGETLDRIEVARALAMLDERSRELVALRYGADLTARQIAEVLGLRTNTVEVALHRATGRLRALLEPEPPQRGAGAAVSPSAP